MKMLLTLREKLVKHRTAHKNGITDLHDCYREGETQFIKELQEKLICRFDKAIQDVENEIERIIKEDDSLLNNYNLIQSVKGIAKLMLFILLPTLPTLPFLQRQEHMPATAGSLPSKNHPALSRAEPKCTIMQTNN
jgi:transposase